MPIARIGLALWLLCAGSVLAGVVPWQVVESTVGRTWPVLAFDAMVTLLAELARDAGLFSSAAHAMARLARGRRAVLFGLVLLLAVAATTFLSLDTTAVLLTPVVVVLAARTGSSPIPLAIATVWLANTASLTLPVSNLTNLLAQGRRELSPAAWLEIYGPASLAAIATTGLVLWVIFRRDLRGRFELAGEDPSHDRIFWWLAVVVLGIALPLFVTEIPPWITSSVAAVLLAGVALVRRKVVWRVAVRHVPWRVMVFASGLFVAAGIAEHEWLAQFAENVSTSSAPAVAAMGAAGANLVNNLPAYLVLEPFAASPLLTGALLIGVNLGPLITPWASLATLLWHRQLVRHGVDLSWGRYMAWGAICAPVVMAVALAVLVLTS